MKKIGSMMVIQGLDRTRRRHTNARSVIRRILEAIIEKFIHANEFSLILHMLV